MKNYLRLTAIFTNEARITGEHGHYYPAALKVINQALKKIDNDDNRFVALTMKTGVLLSQHEFQKALDLGKTALKLNRYNAHIYGALVDAYVELGDYDNAVLMADQMVHIRPDLRSYARISYLREIHGDVKGAKKAMQLAVDAGVPTLEQTAWTRLNLGKLYQNYGDLQKAENEYNKILAFREDYPFAIAALAGIEMEKENFKNAEALLHQATAIIPEVSFYEQLAVLYQKTNREKDFNKIIPTIFEMLKDDELHGHNVDLQYASIYFNLLKNYDKALESCQKEYAKRPQNIDVNRMLAQIYFAKSDYQKAAQHAKVAARTGSVHPELIDVKALLAER
ncbi:MAG TPA: hypothetical protein ENJ53_03720 [Phaeodactylibacter sp.]|nr:hypothetical protein [Phaeodactylibacter sp.]